MEQLCVDMPMFTHTHIHSSTHSHQFEHAHATQNRKQLNCSHFICFVDVCRCHSPSIHLSLLLYFSGESVTHWLSKLINWNRKLLLSLSNATIWMDGRSNEFDDDVLVYTSWNRPIARVKFPHEINFNPHCLFCPRNGLASMWHSLLRARNKIGANILDVIDGLSR